MMDSYFFRSLEKNDKSIVKRRQMAPAGSFNLINVNDF